MINRLEGYTGDGFKERRAYINSQNDINRLQEIKKTNQDSDTIDNNGNFRKNIIYNPSLQLNQFKRNNNLK